MKEVEERDTHMNDIRNALHTHRQQSLFQR